MFGNFSDLMTAMPAIVLALTQVFKKSLDNEGLQDRIVPAFALVLGMALGGLLGAYYGEDIVLAVFNGGVGGLAGIGLYAGIKKTIS